MERIGRTDGKIVGMMTMMMTIAGTMTMTTMTVGTMTMMTIVGKADTVMEMGIMEVVITASTVRQQAEQ